MRHTAEQARIERLLWRGGFGPRPKDRQRLRSHAAALDHLFAPGKGPSLVGPEPTTKDGGRLDPFNEYGHDSVWWLDRSVRARDQLRERMTLNWHDHWACSNSKVNDPRLMFAYYKVLREHSLGNFRDLARAMVRSNAMQIFLDLVGSTDESPNENFAREFFELFTLGAGNGYTERDIRESARALTGFTYDYDSKSFGFDQKRHDGGVKRILGAQGRFDALDVVDRALANKHHAPYLCEKLWGYLSPRPIPPRLLKRTVDAYRSSKFELKPVIRLMLSDPALYTGIDEPDMVKSPVVYVAGMLRQTGAGVRTTDWAWMLDGMGQVPFYPPNVSGWPSNSEWLSTGAVQARFSAANRMIEKTIEDGSISSKQSADEALADAIRFAGRPWTSRRTEKTLHGYARASVAGRNEDYEVKHYWPERQRVLRHILLAGPDAQVC